MENSYNFKNYIHIINIKLKLIFFNLSNLILCIKIVPIMGTILLNEIF